MAITEVLYLLTGTVLLLVVIYDFFFTTLSASGAGFITRFIMHLAHQCLQLLSRSFGRRVYMLSGLLVNLLMLTTWVVLVWTGLFLVFTSNPSGIVNSTGKVADLYDRLYFTGYTLSTLGLGNYKPVTSFFEVLTSGFSFFGFVFFTTSMTYLISVSSAVIHKRSLALSIQSIGNTPDRFIKNLLEMAPFYRFQRVSSLQEMVVRHSVNHQAYPVVHFYSNYYKKSSLSVNLAVLDEALLILLTSHKGENMDTELAALRKDVTHFLNVIAQNYPGTLPAEAGEIDLPLKEESFEGDDNELNARRTILQGFLKNESFTWQDVHGKR